MWKYGRHNKQSAKVDFHDRRWQNVCDYDPQSKGRAAAGWGRGRDELDYCEWSIPYVQLRADRNTGH